MKTDKKRKSSYQVAITNNLFMLKLAYKVNRKRVIFDFIINIIGSCINYYSSIILTYLVFTAMDKHWDFKIVILFFSISGLVMLFWNLIIYWYQQRYRPLSDIDLYEKINLLIYKQAGNVELACFENSEFYNQYTRACTEADNRAVQVIDNLSHFAGSIISTILIVATIISLDIWSIIFILLPVLSNLIITTRRNKATFDNDQINTKSNRVKAYINRTVYLVDYSKELRLTNIINVLIDKYGMATCEIIKNAKVYGKRIAVFRALDDCIMRISRYGICMIYVGARVLVFKTLMVSQFAVLLNAISNLIWSVYSITNIFSTIQKNSLYIQNLRNFMSYVPTIPEDQAGLSPPENGADLSVNNLSFRYGVQEKDILKNINLKVHNGEKIALVGHNGAGKTTLVKLLLRLYDPTEGEISFGGTNIREFNLQAYREQFGTVFQDYKVLSMSVADNILMRKAKSQDKPLVERALQQSGVYEKIISNKEGIDSTMTHEFDENGLVLSGGETQKLAIARIFANNSSLAILDEPSSALDPISEYKMFETLMEACAGRSVIFISHRLSSAILADRIYMLENGEIIETGTHQELMSQNGKYAEMFLKQAENYT